MEFKFLKGLRTPAPQPGHLFCSAIIVASGAARRMNGIDKIMAELDAEPVILRTVRAFQASPAIDEIVVVTRQDLLLPVSELCQRNCLSKVRLVALGGETRTQSVLAGLEHVSKRAQLVAIQDGARPLVTQAIIASAVAKAGRTGAAAPAIAVKDTIKVAKEHVICDTPDRKTLFAVQTPQVFSKDLITVALLQAQKQNVALTDDCSAVEHLGVKVHLVPGSEENLKITTPLDLVVAQAVLDRRNTL